MAQSGERSTEVSSADVRTAQANADTPVAEGEKPAGSNEAGQTSVGTSADTMPTPGPTFTPQDYGVMFALLVAFVVLFRSLVGRRGD